MSNAQHSAESGEWYTPPEWIELVRETLGSIDFDPCSSAKANEIVRAKIYETCTRDSWLNANIFVNPPGSCRPSLLYKFGTCKNSKRCSCKLPQEFIRRSMQAAMGGADIIYLAFSVNQLRQLGKLLRHVPHKLGVSVATPHDRIAYLDPKTMQPVRGTNCDSAFVCLSLSQDVTKRFHDVFGATCAIYDWIK